MLDLRRFAEIVVCDFEFSAPDGERPAVVCMVARELVSGRRHRLFREELYALRAPPFPIGSDALFIAFSCTAEFSCFLALGWALPVNVLDLWVEYRRWTNGVEPPHGLNLLKALISHGLDAMDAVEKTAMRELAMRGGEYSESERAALLAYCEEDVIVLPKLMERMHLVDLDRALFRGRYMKAAAHMEAEGVPIDTESLEQLREHWEAIQDRLISRIDGAFGVYEGRTFKIGRFAEYLTRAGIGWPRLESGQLDLDEDTFREMARVHPGIAPLRELRHSLSQLRLSSLTVGSDGRNRTWLAPYWARTGRNQPSNSRFVFGPSVWLRGLIQARPEHSVSYIDWRQAEFGIAAALSGDVCMKEAYGSDDPYVTYGRNAGVMPADATEASHPAEREMCKALLLATQYLMAAEGLAERLGQPVAKGRELLEQHRRTFRKFWSWSEAVQNHAMLHGFLFTPLGWIVRTTPETKYRSSRNFPMQAGCAEALRLAACLATEAGVRVAAPVHDALLVHCPTVDMPEAIAVTQAAMAKASKIVLGGFQLKTEVKTFEYPHRYMDKRGRTMWRAVWQCIAEIKGCASRKEVLV